MDEEIAIKLGNGRVIRIDKYIPKSLIDLSLNLSQELSEFVMIAYLAS